MRPLLITVCVGLACGAEGQAPAPRTEAKTALATPSAPSSTGSAPSSTGPEVAAAAEPGVAVGEQAPPFSLPDDRGGEVALEQFAGSRAVLLAFYPEDFTGG